MTDGTLEPLPDDLTPEGDEERPGLLDAATLVVGAPAMGKSTHFESERFANHSNITVQRGEDLEAAATVDSDQLVIVDDFYRAYQHTSGDRAALLEELLQRERGVCLVTRPWCLDWLLEQDDSDHPLTVDHIAQFESIYYLQYDSRRNRQAAIEACTDAAGETVESKQLQAVEYSKYEFDSGVLRTYPRSVAPGWAAILSLESNSRWLPVRGAKRALKAIGADASLSESLDRIEKSAGKVFSSGSISLGSAVAGAPLGAAGGLLLVWFLLSDGGLDSDSVFDALLDIEMTPETKENIEKAWGLPPDTIDNLLELNNPETMAALAQLHENPPEEIADDLATVESRVDEFEAELEALDQAVEELETRMQSVEEVIDIEGAAGTLAEFEATIYEEEQRLLRTSVDGEIPYHGGEDHEIVEEVDGNGTGIVVLRGPHGTGKSTAALRACRTLADRGYRIRLPNFDASIPESIEENLETTDGETVLFAFYKRGTSGDNVVSDERDLKYLLKWLDDGLCSAVILECRDELYSSFTDLPKLREGSPDLKQLFDTRESVEFEPLAKDDEPIRAVIDWTIDQLDVELEVDGGREAVREQVIDLAAGNPEIAKIATRFAVTGDDDLAGIETMDELVWRDIEVLFTDVAVGGDTFEYVSALREALTAELRVMLGDDENLAESAYYLLGYLDGKVRERVLEGGLDLPDWMQQDSGIGADDAPAEIALESADNWEITPDVYAEVVFRRKGLNHNGESDDPELGFSRYCRGLGELKNGERYVGLAENLALAYSKADEWEDDDLKQTAVACSYLLLDAASEREIDNGAYVRCVHELVVEGIPIDPGVLEDSTSMLVEGSGTIADDFDHEDIDGETIVVNHLAYTWTNHLVYESGASSERLAKTTSLVAKNHESRSNITSTEFITDIYAIVLFRVADNTNEHTNKSIKQEMKKLEESVQCSIQELCQLEDDPVINTLNESDVIQKIYKKSFNLIRVACTTPVHSSIRSWLREIEHRTIEINSEIDMYTNVHESNLPTLLKSEARSTQQYITRQRRRGEPIIKNGSELSYQFDHEE